MTAERKELLIAAIDGWRQTIARLSERIAIYEAELSGASSHRPTQMGRKMSAEGRERIAAATRKRWIEYRAKKAAGAA